MCRQTLASKIDNMYVEKKKELIDRLSKVEVVCTTADSWKTYGRSFLGVTCHWLDPVSLLRQSACLIIRRLKGKQTYDVLAKALEGVHAEFKISKKVAVTITDSGSNFLKAFRMFSVVNETPESQSDEEEEDQENLNVIFNISFLCYKNLIVLKIRNTLRSMKFWMNGTPKTQIRNIILFHPIENAPVIC